MKPKELNRTLYRIALYALYEHDEFGDSASKFNTREVREALWLKDYHVVFNIFPYSIEMLSISNKRIVLNFTTSKRG